MYNANGYLSELRNADTSNALLWRADSINAEGQTTQSTLGNNVVTNTAYDATTGRVQSIQTGAAGAVQNLAFSFDLTGNLIQRQDVRQGKTETFGYDSLYRLTTSQVSGLTQKTNTYDALGNFTSKAGVGNYTYGTGITTTAGSAGPHAVVATSTGTKTYQYDTDGNMTKELAAGSLTKSLSYSSYDAVVGMTGTGSPAPTITFLYGADRNRVQQNHSVNGVTTYVYAGSTILYERLVKNTTTTNTHYLYAGGVNIGVFVTKTGAANDTRYFHRDHLGSIDAVTNAAGTVIERMSFDAWGARRNTDWTDATGPITVTSTLRGFTGHEMLDALGLIHMNGRVYNPVLGKFLSADPFIQFASNLQSYNRYSYVLNNPLSYTDPDGYGLFGFFKSIFKAVSSLFKAVTSFITSILRILPGPLRTIAAIAVNFIPGINVYAAGFLSGLIASGGDLKSGIIGAVTFGLGDALKLGNGFLNFVARGVANGIGNVINGGDFLAGFVSAGVRQLLGGIQFKLPSTIIPFGYGRAAEAMLDSIRASVIGGISSVLGGGKFGNGALTAAFSNLFFGGSAGAVQRSGASILSGALSVVGKLWTLPNTVVGFLVGVAGIPFGATPTLSDNAIVFNKYPWGSGGALTIGNVILNTADTLNVSVPTYWAQEQTIPFGISFLSERVRLGDHERAHTYQYQVLGIFFAPLYLLDSRRFSAASPFESTADQYALREGSWWPW